MLEAPIPPQSLKREPPSRLLSVASSAPSSQPKFAELVNAPSFPPTLSGQTTSQSATPHVPIQPRVVNGTSHPPPASPASPAEPPTKKRRGRPPRRQNLRDVSKPPPRPLHPLAPHPAVGASPAVPTQEGKGTPGQIAGETRGQKRGRGSSDETVRSAVSIGMMPCRADTVKEIKAEGSVATPPTRSSPVVCSESDGAEDGKES